MQKESKMILVGLTIAIIMFLGFIKSDVIKDFVGIQGELDEYCLEATMEWKYDDVLPSVTFFHVVKGTSMIVRLYEPGATDYKRTRTTTAPNDGDVKITWSSPVYLDIVGNWRVDYDITTTEGRMRTGSYLDVSKYKTNVNIKSYNVEPLTAMIGDTISCSYQIKNEGDLDANMVISIEGNNDVLYSTTTFLGVGESYSDVYSFVLDQSMVYTKTMMASADLFIEATGIQGEYSDEQCYLTDNDIEQRTIAVSYPKFNLLVQTNPVSCIVTVKGLTPQTTSATTGATTFSLASGTYEINISKTGYYSQIKTAAIVSSSVTLPIVTLIKIPTLAKLQVKTMPPYSLVKLYGVEEKTSDVNGIVEFTNLATKSYTLAVSHDGYVTNTGTVVIDKDTTITRTLVKIYTLKITTTPTGCTITIPGQPTKITDSQGIITYDLIEGTYRVTASKGGYPSMSSNITLANDGEISFNLQKQQSNTNITPVPPQPNKTPGFEIPLILCAFAIFIVLKRRKK
jgi:hypothetical protein